MCALRPNPTFSPASHDLFLVQESKAVSLYHWIRILRPTTLLEKTDINLRIGYKANSWFDVYSLYFPKQNIPVSNNFCTAAQCYSFNKLLRVVFARYCQEPGSKDEFHRPCPKVSLASIN